MPVTRSAKKKLRADRKRESANKKMDAFVKLSIKKAQRKPTTKSIQEAFRIIDKSVKKNIIHKNKASRIKSRLSKLLNKKTGTAKKPTVTTKTKKSSKKSA